MPQFDMLGCLQRLGKDPKVIFGDLLNTKLKTNSHQRDRMKWPLFPGIHRVPSTGAFRRNVGLR